MKTKKCSNCGEIKPIDEFYKSKTNIDGHQNNCKTCSIKQVEQYRINNFSPEQLKKHKLREKRKKLLKEDKYICSKCGKTKPLSEFHKSVSRPHGYSYVCKNCKRKRDKKRYSKMKQDPERIKQKKSSAKKFYNNRKKDPQYKLNILMSTNIYRSLKDNKNGKHWEDLVDYTLDKLKKHLEEQFDNKMSWENQGSYWHVDHIIPKSKFNYTKPEHIGFKRAWALENLQPLEVKENIRKSNKLIRDKQEYLMI